MDKIKIGIAGLNRGKTHIKKAALCPKVEVTAICDLNKEKADSIAVEFNIRQVYGSLDEMLAASGADIDAVILATPIPDHADHVIKVLNAGKHVLSEVTAVTEMEDCSRLAEAVRASGKKYMLAENYCYYRPITILRNMIKDGLLGEVYYAESDYLMDFRLRGGFPEQMGWRKNTYFMHRGDPYITHSLGPLASAMDEKISKVACMGSGRSFPQLKADNTCVLMCQTEKGNMIRLRHSFISARPDMYTYYSLQGTKGCYQGAQGPTDFHKVHIRGLCKPSEWKNIFEFKEYIPSKWGMVPSDTLDDIGYDDGRSQFDSGTPLMIDDFADSIINDTKTPIDIDTALNWTAAGLLSEQSIDNGSVSVEIPQF